MPPPCLPFPLAPSCSSWRLGGSNTYLKCGSRLHAGSAAIGHVIVDRCLTTPACQICFRRRTLKAKQIAWSPLHGAWTPGLIFLSRFFLVLKIYFLPEPREVSGDRRHLYIKDFHCTGWPAWSTDEHLFILRNHGIWEEAPQSPRSLTHAAWLDVIKFRCGWR